MAAVRVRAVILFARLPVPGRVKTRLAASLGNRSAYEFYLSCAENIIHEISRLKHCRKYLYFSDANDEFGIAEWIQSLGYKDSISIRPQLNIQDIGMRMDSAIKETFKEGANQIVLIGSDIPDLNLKIIKSAFDSLEQYQIVWGPSMDGGYYLVGVNGIYSCIFTNIPWSTEKVLEKSISVAQNEKLLVPHIPPLPRLFDIDTVEDLNAWLEVSHHQELQNLIKNQECKTELIHWRRLFQTMNRSDDENVDVEYSDGSLNIETPIQSKR